MSRVLQDANAPAMSGGVQVGDVTGTRAMIWSAADRPARMLVEVVARRALHRRRASSKGRPRSRDTRFTAKIDLGGLTPGEPVFYRVWFDDLERPGLLQRADRSASSAPRPGRAPPHDLLVRRRRRAGLGHRRARGGMRLYETMARHAPDLFIHSGDQIYADNPLKAGGDARRRDRLAERRDRRPSRRWPRRWTSSAATSPTTCSTATRAPSTARCR